jgi:hypothetical protein
MPSSSPHRHASPECFIAVLRPRLTRFIVRETEDDGNLSHTVFAYSRSHCRPLGSHRIEVLLLHGIFLEKEPPNWWRIRCSNRSRMTRQSFDEEAFALAIKPSYSLGAVSTERSALAPGCDDAFPAFCIHEPRLATPQKCCRSDKNLQTSHVSDMNIV